MHAHTHNSNISTPMGRHRLVRGAVLVHKSAHVFSMLRASMHTDPDTWRSNICMRTWAALYAASVWSADSLRASSALNSAR
eukprot:365166-Chlamydomonas_euryale.AAC.10